MPSILKPNSLLEPLSVLIGEWDTIGTHPMLPGRLLYGHASFQWHENGAFIIMRTEMNEPEIPTGLAIFGSDDSIGEYFMLYYDERGVSRKYEMSMKNDTWKWWRYVPTFSQRFTCMLTDDGRTIISKGELSRDGVNWEGDLELTYTRVG